MNPSAEACCMIEGWDPKHLWERARLLVRHILQCRPHRWKITVAGGWYAAARQSCCAKSKNDGTTIYECEVCHNFHGDSKAMRQHMAATAYGWKWPTKCGWLVWTLQSAQTWVSMYVVWYLKLAWCQSRKGPKHHGWVLHVVWDQNLATIHTVVSWSTRRNPRTKADGSLQTGKIQNLLYPVQMWPYGVLGVRRCFGNGICTNTFLKTTPIWWSPLPLSQVSQWTRMKEIMSRVSSRIRDKRWLPSVPRMTRSHTTVIVYFNTDSHNKNKVACLQFWGLYTQN